MKNSSTVNKRIPIGFLAIYIFIFITILSAAYLIYYNQKKSIEKDKENLLISISRLKLEQILDWRNDKLDDAKVIINEDYLRGEIKNFIKDKFDLDKRLKLLSQFNAFLRDRDYDKVILTDKYHNLILNTGEKLKSINKTEKLYVEKAVKYKRIILSDFFIDSLSKKIYLDLTFPLTDINNELIGTLILRINPNYSLYPAIQTWPVPDKTSETLLFERRGEQLVYLNELRHKKNTALKFFLPISSSELPAAKYIRGEKGVLSGKDYIGREVVAYGQKIPGTEWYLLTKTDTSGMYSNIKSLFIIILVVAILLIIIVGFIFLFLLNKQAEKHYIEIIKIEQSKKELQDNYESLLRNANDMVFVSDESGNFKFVNHRVIANYGYSVEEISNLFIKDISVGISQFSMEEYQKRISESNGYIFEGEHKRKDGTIFPVEISARVIEIDGKKYYQSFVRDISERKDSERKIYRLNRVYSLLSNINQMIVRVKDKSKLFEDACKIAVNDGGFRMAWIGIINDVSGNLEIVSHSGYVGDYIENIIITRDKPETMTGPAGICLMLGIHNICNDIENDNKMKPWRTAALKNKFYSAGSFPIIVHGEVIGNINLYSDKKNFFNEEEIKLLDEMANDISYAVEFLDNEEKRARIETELQKSYKRYKELFENNPNPMWMYDGDTLRFKDVNKTAIRQYGYSREEFLSMTLKDIRPKEDISAFIENVAKNPDDYPVRGIWRHRKKDGTIIFAEVKSNSLPNSENKNYRIVLVNDVTEKLKAEDALKLSEERMRVIVEGTPHLFFYVQDADANTIYVSPTVERITGYKVEQWLNQRDWFIADSKINHNAKEITQAHLRGEYTKNSTLLEIHHSDGHAIILEAYESPIIKDGKAIGTQGVAHDITERKLAEEALKESEQRFRTIFENSMVGIYRTTPDGRILLANQALIKMLGYESFEDLSKRDLGVDYSPSYQRSQFIQRIEKEGKIVGYEAEWVKKDGSTISIRENAQVIRDQSGMTIYFDGIVEDITKRKKAEDELKKLYIATEQSPASIIITDVKGNIEYVNTKLAEVSGYTLDEVRGKNPRIFQSGNKTNEDYKKLWDTILSGEQWRGEFYNKKKDGTFYWESASISSIKNSEGKITHFIAVKEDITDIKRILNELIIAKEKAEEANKTKDLFLANMSHELRTPLIGILGYSDILAETLLQQEQNEMAKGINRSGNRLLKTLNLLLDLTRIKSDKFETSIIEKEITEELKFAYEMFREAAIEKKLEFSLKNLNENLTAKVDSSMLLVILENLINNAIKFTNRGSISLIAGKENNKEVFIKVKDTGIGIDEKNFDIIFEEFRQVSEGTNREFQGTGLGLSITKKYVEILNGTIKVESKINEGTTFTVILPAV